jgi:hypothetical protein
MKIACAAIDEYWTSLGYDGVIGSFGYDQVREVVTRLLDDPQATPEQHHAAERLKLLDDGWKPGDKCDYEKKTFTAEAPRYFMPYAECYGEEVCTAHRLVVAVVRALAVTPSST